MSRVVSFLKFTETIALEAGQMAMNRFRQPFDIEYKGDRDLVTAVDREVEAFIIDAVRKEYPSHSIWGEESGKVEGASSYSWIIDPIDGTTSFVHGQPFFSTSIALYKDSQPVVGAVNAPALNELFMAETGGGATLNGQPIVVSKRDTLVTSVLGTGFACLRAESTDNNLKYFNEIAPKLRGVRRYGSCAIDLAYVACGRLDGFWEIGLAPYDVAAGVLLVQEAGGKVCDFDGGTRYPEQGTVATNGGIHSQLLSSIAEVKGR